MIRVDRSQTDIPEVLQDNPDSPGSKEKSKALTHFSDPTKRDKSFPFKIYKNEGVVTALNKLFYFKCAYCESSYKATQPVDVEHYRPKGSILVGDVELKPGYYWLAADWKNLVPSCIDCNRERYQREGGAPGLAKRLRGKANKFPLAVETARWRAPEDSLQEEPLLLHPCEEDPAQHLEFVEAEGQVVVRPLVIGGKPSPKGDASIKVLGLNRLGLVEERTKLALQIRIMLVEFKELVTELEQTTNPEPVKLKLVRKMEQLKQCMEDPMEYAGMARQLIRPALQPYIQS